MYTRILQRSPEIRNASIIIVDDNEASRTVISKIFESEGFNNISFAEDGEEALKKIKTTTPDIIIADLFMPKIDGQELIKKVREIREFDHIPIIIQTSSKDLKDINKAFENGASDIISKPVQKLELLSRALFQIENVIFRKRILLELDAAKDLQTSMLPNEEEVKSVHTKYNIDVASCFIPSSEVGGDFWGFKKISHSELGIYNVDLSGHGVAAALNTFRVQSLLNDPKNFFSSTSMFLKKLNKRMIGLMPVGQFSTMFYGVINLVDNFIQYSSASSPGGIVLRANGATEILKVSGFPLGVTEEAEYDSFEVSYKAGDTIIVFSDALVETGNAKGDFLSYEDICKTLTDSKGASAQKILDNIHKKFKDHVGNCYVSDDLTINVYKRL